MPGRHSSALTHFQGRPLPLGVFSRLPSVCADLLEWGALRDLPCHTAASLEALDAACLRCAELL